MDSPRVDGSTYLETTGKEQKLIDDLISNQVALRFEEFKGQKEKQARNIRNRDGCAYDVFKRNHQGKEKELELANEFLGEYGEAMVDTDKHAEME